MVKCYFRAAAGAVNTRRVDAVTETPGLIIGDLVVPGFGGERAPMASARLGVGDDVVSSVVL